VISFSYRRFSGGQIKKHEMGEACARMGEKKISYKFLVRKSEGKRSL
jgi:hypothetical protein